MDRKRICLVDDEINILDVIGVFFQQNGFDVVKFHSSEDFRTKYNDLKNIDAFVIDYMMPGETDGMSVVKMIRKSDPLIPIFMLTASDAKEQVIAGIEAGADDYITKPCHLTELLARLNNAIKKHTYYTNKDTNLKMLTEGKVVMYKGSSVSLTSREFSIFRELFLNEGQPVDRDKLLSTIEPDSSEMIKRNVDVHVFSLRRKLASINVEVRTVRGIGYQLHVQ